MAEQEELKATADQVCAMLRDAIGRKAPIAFVIVEEGGANVNILGPTIELLGGVCLLRLRVEEEMAARREDISHGLLRDTIPS